ncbi:11249_t:CDS:2, partial [Acaulospora colombiana]
EAAVATVSQSGGVCRQAQSPALSSRSKTFTALPLRNLPSLFGHSSPVVPSLPAKRSVAERAERIRWGVFIMDEEHGNGIWEEEQLDRVPKLKKISRSTNSYAEWACRSMISRCEHALHEEQRLIAQMPGNVCSSPEAFMEGQTQPQQEGMPSEKESRRSSASSTFTSAISASSRASSSHEQIEGDIPDVPFDTDGLSQPLLSATLRAPRPNTISSAAHPAHSNPSAAASLRRASTLRTAVDRFRCLHDSLVEEALCLMDNHSAAMRILEERGRRRGWSSTESGLSRSSKLSATKTWPKTTNPPPISPFASSYGTGASVWELSIPLVRSSLGEISSTWEDWQMEWEMERDFGCEDSESFDMGAFPDIISEFGNEVASMDELDPSSRSSFTIGEGEEGVLDHSGFSDSDSSDEEAGVDPEIQASGKGAAASTSKIPRRKKSTRGHRAGAQARLGTYEDVRDELPPSPPLLSLSPPPKATKQRE